LFQWIVAGECNFAEVAFSQIIHQPKVAIPPSLSEVEGTGGTALLQLAGKAVSLGRRGFSPGVKLL
jgi:hypothetical protein